MGISLMFSVRVVEFLIWFVSYSSPIFWAFYVQKLHYKKSNHNWLERVEKVFLIGQIKQKFLSQGKQKLKLEYLSRNNALLSNGNYTPTNRL